MWLVMQVFIHIFQANIPCFFSYIYSMMSRLLLCVLLLQTMTFVHGQNKRDANGKRHGKWVYTGKMKPEYGYDKNTTVEEGYYVHGRKEGVWIKYYADGKTPKIKGNYNNNRPQGDYNRYFKEGKLKERGSFAKDQYKGELIRYHANGIIAYRGNYNNEGIESGLVQYFHENGNVALEYTVKNGKLSGELKRYYEDGALKEKLTFDEKGKVTSHIDFAKTAPKTKPENEENKQVKPPKLSNPNTRGVKFEPNGYNKVYNESQEIWMDGQFKNGQLWDGKVFDYNSDGILMKVRVFKDGKYHSDGQL